MNKKVYFIFALLCATSVPLCPGELVNTTTMLIDPWKEGDQTELMEFDFEDADLSVLLQYMQEQFNITFIVDDALKPLPKDGKSVLGIKVNFRTHKSLTKKDAWALFLKFLDMADLTVVPGPTAKVYRITSIKTNVSKNGVPLPTFIGTNPDLLPDNDTYIRYIHFVKDASLNIIESVLNSMKSVSSPPFIKIEDMRAFLITDKAYNIKTMLNVVRELDTVTMPETMSIIKLKKTDAQKVADLYKSLTTVEGGDKLATRLSGARAQQTLHYFTPGTRVIPEPRTNTLIVLGTEEAVRKIEDFIVREIDKDIEKPYTPLHVYELKHLKAESVAAILNQVVQFQPGSDAAKTGSVREGVKFFKPMSIVPEKSGNRLVITADYEDYLKIHEILQKIDIEQPQVAMRVLVVEVDISDTKQLGAQIRNKKPGVDGFLGDNVNFQTSGLANTRSIVENTAGTGATRLLGDLISLATNGAVGSTYITMGSDCYGVWGMLRILEVYTHSNVVSSPFLITTNNYPATISLGETRRILSAQTIGAAGEKTDSFGNIDANLTVKITPQISYEGFITLDIIVQDNNFTTIGSDPATAGNRTERQITTSVILANNEVLALGGIIRDTFTDIESKVPILGDIPIVGWLFKNKSKVKTRNSLLVLVAPEIIPVYDTLLADKVTADAIRDAEATMLATNSRAKQIDPIHRWFFEDNFSDGAKMVDQFINKEQNYLIPSQRKTLGPKKRLSEYL